MNVLRFAVAIGWMLSACGAQSPGKSSLASTLAALDASSAKFRSAEADFQKDLYTAAVKDDTLQEGKTYAIRSGGESEVGIKIVGSGARTVVYRKGEAKDYTPGLGCFNTYSVQKSKSTIESLLGLAFGASGKELESNWKITDLGAETIESDGKKVAVEKLDLLPKEAGLANNVVHVELWIDLVRAISLKQVIYTSRSGDKQTAVYSHVRLNEKKVDTAPFEIKGKPCSK